MGRSAGDDEEGGPSELRAAIAATTTSRPATRLLRIRIRWVDVRAGAV
jgi:hypothetical protein